MSRASAPGSRLPGVLIFLGAFLFLAAGFTEVGGDVYSADSADEVAAALEDARTSWNVSNWAGAAAVVIVAVGLFLLGSQLARAPEVTAACDLRACRAAKLLARFGVLTTVQVVIQAYNATASTETLADTYSDPTSSPFLIFFGIAWTIACFAVFVTLGLALRWLHHQVWLAWFALVVGVFAVLVVGVFLGPSAAYLVLGIAGVALTITPYGAGRSAIAA